MADIWYDVDTALAEVPVNLLPLVSDTDFKTIDSDVNYDAAGLVLIWHFVTTAGAYSQTAVTPTTGGNYDWTEQGNGMFTIEIPASGGASINNDTEGFGWFTGVCPGQVLPFRGPVCGFRAAGTNNLLIDSAASATRGLAGTALPDAAADAAGGLPISDAGGLDLDAKIGALTYTVANQVDVNLVSWLGTAGHAATVAGVPVVQLHNSAGTGGINAPANFEDLNITDTTGLVRPDMANASGNYAGTVATVTTLTNAVTLANGAHGGAATVITLQTPIVANATQIEGGDATDALNAATPASVQNIPVDGSLTVTLRNGAHGGAAATAQFGGAGGITSLLTGNVTGTVAGVTPAAAGDAMTLTVAERNAVAAALLDLANGVETGYTLRQTLRIMAAVLAGKSSGYPGGPGVFRNLADAADRVTATNDADGNRTAMVHTP